MIRRPAGNAASDEARPTLRRLHAVRGATTVSADSREEIEAATVELLLAIVGANGLLGPEIVSALFTVTPDLRSDFPARAARERLGWTDVPLMCMAEIGVPGALPRCIRVLIHLEFAEARRAPFPVYLRGAVTLRADVASVPSG